MIAAALQLFTFARSLSAKTWLVVITLVAVLAAGVRLVTYGEHREALRVATLARVDTIKTDLAALHVAQSAEVNALAHMAAAKPATITTAMARTKARSLVVLSAAKDLHLAPADSLPTAIITLITADDAKIAADSIYIAAAGSLKASLDPLERAHATLDTTLIHPLGALTEQTSGFPGGRYAIVGILGIGARLCFNLVRHRSPLP